MSRKRRKPRNEAELKNYNLKNFINEKKFSPIEASKIKKIAKAAVKILAEIGMSDAPKELCDLVLKRGGKLEGNRLIYPPDLIENTIAKHQRIVLLAGQTIENDLHVGGNHVYAERVELPQIYKILRRMNMFHLNLKTYTTRHD